MSEVSNIRKNTQEERPKYLILDGRAEFDEDAAEVMEAISEKEFKKNFNSDLEQLKEYASDEYGGVVIEN